MTGGIAYIWDEDGSFVASEKFHTEFVEAKALTDLRGQ